MAERSAISWTRSTFNPWIGCTKIGPGCDHCYAEALDKRHRWGGDTHWGDDKPRHRTSVHYWNDPLRWQRAAVLERELGRVAKGNWHTPGFWPVFCASLADVFDNQVPQGWRADLWDLIEATPNLSWLLVTKRIGNVRGMVPVNWLQDSLHPERDGFPANVRLLITVVNQEETDRDIPKLLALPCKNGISYEPALGPVDWWPFLAPPMHVDWTKKPDVADYAEVVQVARAAVLEHGKRFVDWVIVGGESIQGGQARPFDLVWAISTIRQCKHAGVPVFVKQLGSRAVQTIRRQAKVASVVTKDRAGADPAEWPADLRVQEFPK